jgi:bacteriocin biosynthesis cyclodehydratase domain-containing protein
VIEEFPEYLPDFIAFLSGERTLATAQRWLTDRGLSAADSAVVLEELREAGFLVRALPDPDSRYSRHHLYYQSQGIDPTVAQHKLAQSTVGLIGTGGIGSNVATLLAAAGVGHLVVSDGDTVELSNLTRQTLYTEESVGRLKVEVAAARLREINSEVKVTPVPFGFDSADLVSDYFADCDFIVLSADTPREIHEWISTKATALGIPYSTAGYIEGYAVVGPLVVPGETACYECSRNEHAIFGQLRGDASSLRQLNLKRQAPSFGPLNFYVAAVQVNEAIRYLTGLTPQTLGTRRAIDFATYETTEEHYERRADCPACSPAQTASAKPNASASLDQLPAIAEQYATEREDASFNSLLLDPLIARLVSAAGEGERALDIGCGTGENSRMLGALGYGVTAVDIEPAMLRTAVERTTDTGIEYHLAGISEIPRSESNDLVLCLNVLDWVEDLDGAIGSIRGALRPGGRAIVAVPHPFKDSGAWLKKWDGRRWRYDDFSVTGHYFSEGPIAKSREDADGATTVERTITFKRTATTYVNAFLSAGFNLLGYHEPAPTVQDDSPEILLEKSMRVPYFLLLDLKLPNEVVEH